MEFVVLEVYDEYVSAHIAKGRLEEEGIVCWLKDENIVTVHPLISIAVGGIKLMVPKHQEERAREILNNPS